MLPCIEKDEIFKIKEFDEAIEIFTELEIIHPYSSFSSKVN